MYTDNVHISSEWNPDRIHPCQVSYVHCSQRRTALRSSASSWKVRQHASRPCQKLAINTASSRVNAMTLPSKAWETQVFRKKLQKRRETVALNQMKNVFLCVFKKDCRFGWREMRKSAWQPLLDSVPHVSVATSRSANHHQTDHQILWAQKAWHGISQVSNYKSYAKHTRHTAQGGGGSFNIGNLMDLSIYLSIYLSTLVS